MSLKITTPRTRFAFALLGAAVLAAVAAAVVITAAYAAPLPATVAAQTGSPSTHIDDLVREWEALRNHLALAIGVFTVLITIVLLAFAYFARASSKVTLLWGIAQFELPDELRKTRAKLAKSRESEKLLIRATNDFYGLAASLSDIAASATRGEIRDFVGLCTEATQQVLAAYKSSAWLFDSNAQVLRIFAGQRVSSRTIHGFTLAPGKGFAGHVFQTKTPLLLDDVATQPNLFERDPNAPQDIGSLLGVPIWGQNGQPVGVLCASHYVNGETFSAQDVTLVSIYADLISVALHLARLNNLAVP